MAPVAICLYSKYSQRCKEFMDDLPDDLNVEMLCVDNKEVRKTIMRDDHGYHIKTVPCIFLFYSNGRLEKYEGSDAFVWLRKHQEVRTTDEKVVVEIPKQLPQSQLAPQPPSQATSSRIRTEMLELRDPDDREAPPPSAPSSTDFEEEDISKIRASEQLITRKQDNIKELAQAMQRQRESEEEQMNPPPPGSRTFDLNK